MPEDYFAPGSTDEILAAHLRDGDVVLFNQRCSSLFSNPIAAMLCAASKYGLSGEGRHCWDHAAVVVHKHKVPYLLEGGPNGVTMRTYEERLLQGTDHQEIIVLPLRTGGDAASVAAEDDRRAAALSGLTAELRLQPSPDGFDAAGASRCQNMWATYRALRQPYSKRGRLPDTAVSSESASSPALAEGGGCTFGATLVARALQHLGALEARVDAAQVTPAALPSLPLSNSAFFARPMPVRSLGQDTR